MSWHTKLKEVGQKSSQNTTVLVSDLITFAKNLISPILSNIFFEINLSIMNNMYSLGFDTQIYKSNANTSNK